MKKYKPCLCIAAFVFLVCVFTPDAALAQDDGPVEWPCVSTNNYSLTSPWCNSVTQGDDSILQAYNTLTQNGGIISRPYAAPAQDSGQVLQFHNIFVGITPSTGDEVLYQQALFEGRREEFALIRS